MSSPACPSEITKVGADPIEVRASTDPRLIVEPGPIASGAAQTPLAASLHSEADTRRLVVDRVLGKV